MQNIEKEFNTYYLEQLNQNNPLPSFITEFFTIRACLSFSDTKCIYIISDIIFDQKYILKQVSKQHLSQSEKEWDMLSSLKHPSIPKAYKWYSDDQYTYMIREYFDGMAMDAYVLGNGTVQEDDAVELAVKLCDLLTYLHSRTPPVIHRDIKPQNLILRPDGGIGLIDFETSRHFDLQAGNDTVYMGTLQTAAPEQFGYRQTNQQTDIYALGILLLYLETGSYDRADTCHMTPRLKKIAERCTEFSPKDRYKSVEEVKMHLLGKRNSVFSKKMVVGLSALFVGSTIVFSLSTAIPPARQDESKNYAEIALNDSTKDEEGKETIPIKDEETKQTEATDPEETVKQAEVTNPEETAKQTGATNPEETVKQTGAANPEGTVKQTEPTKYEEIKTLKSAKQEDTETVSFKNPGIEKAVRMAINKTAGEPLLKSEVEKIIYLELNGNLSEYVWYNDFSHDFYMNRLAYKGEFLERGPIDSLEELAKLPYLIDLILMNQQISDLSGIEKLTHLQQLNLCYNYVSDLTPLKDLKKLTMLRINSNPIKDLSPLKDLSKLDSLEISATNVTDLSPLSSLKSLTTLGLWGMKNMDLSPLKDMENLKNIIN